jgi:hypothetical protein
VTVSEILDNLEALKRQMLETTGMEPRELVCTGRTLIELYRRGFLRPGDQSVRVLIPDSDRAEVERFLASFTGPDLE